MPLWLTNDFWWMRPRESRPDEGMRQLFQRMDEARKEQVLANQRMMLEAVQVETQRATAYNRMEQDAAVMQDMPVVQEYGKALQDNPNTPFPTGLRTAKGVDAATQVYSTYWMNQARRAVADAKSEVNQTISKLDPPERLRAAEMIESGAPMSEVMAYVNTAWETKRQRDMQLKRTTSAFDPNQRFDYFSAQNAIKAADDRAEDVVKIVTSNKDMSDEVKKAEVAKARLSAQREKERIMEQFKQSLAGAPNDQNFTVAPQQPAPAAEKRVKVEKNGVVGTIPESQLERALKEGYTIPKE